MSRARMLCQLLLATLIIGFLPSFFHLGSAYGANLVGHYAVYCIGDSLTADDYYEAELRTLLGADSTVVNKGIDANTTAQMLTRFSADVLADGPDLVVIWGGGHDIRQGLTPLSTTESNLQSMYTQAHNAGITVIAISMSPWKGASDWTVDKQVLTDSLHDWIMNTAIDVDFRVEVYDLLEDADTNGLLPAYDSGDHLHLNNAAGVVIGQAIYDTVFAPAKPSNLAPADGAISVGLTPTLQSSPFSAYDASFTHAASQWQITELPGDYSSPVFDSQTDSTNLTNMLVPAGKLACSTTYYWHVRHQDNHGDWWDWSAETSFLVSCSPPSQPANAWPVDGVSCMTLTPTLRASALSDPEEGVSHTASQWQITAVAGDYSSPIFDTSTDTSNLIAITIPSEKLDYSTTYYWHVRYQDNHGNWSGWSLETAFTTLAITSAAQEVPVGGGTVETGDGRTTVGFPAAALSTTATVTIEQVTSSSVPGTPKGFKVGSTFFTIEARDADGNAIVTLSQPVTVTVKYSQADVDAAGADPSNLVIAYYDDAAGEWKPLDATDNTTDKTLSTTTTHLSTWGILAKAAESREMPLWVWIVVGIAVAGVAAFGLVAAIGFFVWRGMGKPPLNGTSFNP